MPSVVNDRYEVAEVVGAGAQGEVAKARDRRHDRLVAIKSRDGTDAAVLEEARVLYRVRPHASLPLLREDFVEDDRLFLVMDWIEGETLACDVERSGPVSLDSAVSLLRPVGEALDHLHAHRPYIAHGDVKPANIVRSRDGRVVLVDFGLAGYVRAGTPGYRAPELASGAAGPAADVYGLSATAYTLLTGRPPAPGEFAPMPLVPEVHRARVRRALEWGLQVLPDRRPAHAGTLLDAIAGSGFPHNLPRHLSSFVGRVVELRELDEAVRSRRLVTLVGPPGSGKTRLAVESARVLGTFTGGVVLVDLAAVTSGVAARLLHALGVTREAPDPLDAAVARLSSANRLVVFDNAEHILDETAEVCVGLAERCPSLRLLVTSREAMRVPGETIVRIGGLPAGTDSVRLVIDRMTEARPGWRATRADLDAGARIASSVDGLPLALELVAARAVDEGLDAVLAAVAERLDSLGVLRGKTEHHRTLAALIDHSYALLDQTTRAVLRAASVLVGGIDARILAEIADRPQAEVSAALGRAESASLAEHADDRWRMLEPVRQRLADHLGATGETEPVDGRLRSWAARFAHTTVKGDPAFTAEEPNVRVALKDLLVRGELDEATLGAFRALYKAAHKHGDYIRLLVEARDARLAEGGDLPLRFLTSLGTGLALTGRRDKARPVLDEVVDRAAREGDAWSQAEALLDRAAYSLTVDAEADLARASRLVDELNDARLRVRLLLTRGIAGRRAGRLDEAEQLLGEAADAGRASGEARLAALALAQRIPINAQRGEFDTAERLANEMLDFAQTSGSVGDSAATWHALGNISSMRGDLDEAERRYERALELFSSIHDPRGMDALQELGAIAMLRGRHDAADAQLREAHALALTHGDLEGAEIAAITLADNAQRARRPTDALHYLADALPGVRQRGDPYELGNALRVEAACLRADGRVSEALLAARESLEQLERGSVAPLLPEARDLVGSLERELRGVPSA